MGNTQQTVRNVIDGPKTVKELVEIKLPPNGIEADNLINTLLLGKLPSNFDLNDCCLR